MQNSPLKNMLLVTDLWKSLLLNIIENMHDIGNGLIKETIQRYIITYNNQYCWYKNLLSDMFGLSLQGGSRPLLMAACWYTMLVCPTQDSTAVWQSTQWLDGTEQPITSSISKSCGPRRVNTHWQSQCLVTKSLKMQLSLSWKVDCPVLKYVLRVSNGQISWWQGMQSTNLCQKQNFLSLRTNLVPPSTYFLI